MAKHEGKAKAKIVGGGSDLGMKMKGGKSKGGLKIHKGGFKK